MIESDPIAPPCGRRAARKEERRKAILAVALAVFCDQGYAAATMSAIAARLGGSKGTLWRYFASKEELFRAVTDEVSGRVAESVVPLLDSGLPLREALLRFCHHFIATISTPEAIAIYRMIVGESGQFPELGRGFRDNNVRRIESGLAAFVARHMEDGTLRREDPARIATTITSLCLGEAYREALWGSLPPDPAKVAADAAYTTDLVLRCYTARPMT
jgi:AcrR family transcriptional regulator